MRIKDLRLLIRERLYQNLALLPEDDSDQSSTNPNQEPQQSNDESPAAQMAHHLGLVHKAFGMYVKPEDPNTVIAKTVNGQLVKIDPHKYEDPSHTTEPNPTVPAGNKTQQMQLSKNASNMEDPYTAPSPFRSTMPKLSTMIPAAQEPSQFPNNEAPPQDLPDPEYDQFNAADDAWNTATQHGHGAPPYVEYPDQGPQNNEPTEYDKFSAADDAWNRMASMDAGHGAPPYEPPVETPKKPTWQQQVDDFERSRKQGFSTSSQLSNFMPPPSPTNPPSTGKYPPRKTPGEKKWDNYLKRQDKRNKGY